MDTILLKASWKKEVTEEEDRIQFVKNSKKKSVRLKGFDQGEV